MHNPKRRLNLIRTWGGIITGILGAAGLVWYINRYATEFYRLRDISAVGVGVLSLIVLIGHLVIALKFNVTAQSFNVTLHLTEAFFLTEAGSFMNIVPLNLGTGFRAAYLKKVRNLKFVDFGIGFLALLLTEFIAAGALGLIASLTLSNVSPVLELLFLVYILTPIALLVIAWFLRKRTNDQSLNEKRHEKWLARLKRSLSLSLDTMLSQPRLIVYLFLLNVLTDLILGIRYWLVAKWLNYSVNFASSMVLQSVSRATAIFAVVPSGTIGLREALAGLGATSLGKNAIDGVMISTIDRIVATAWIVLMGTLSMFILRQKIAKVYARDSIEV
jgi:hypothetical protein